MKIYWYETNGSDGLLIACGGKWVDIYGGKIDDITVCAENAVKIANNIRNGEENGGFDFIDWYNNANYRSNPPHFMRSGTNPRDFLESCEKYNEI